MTDVLVCWSGGKDSALAFHELLRDEDVNVAALLTTVTEGYDRISMHGVRCELLEAQAAALDVPLEKVYIPIKASNEQYEARMGETLERYCAQDVRTAVFGDIFLEDLRRYREENLAKLGMQGRFPIWKRDTAELARAFIELGFSAVICCVDTRVLDGAFAGRVYDRDLLRDLPARIDPCGENGEFHSFVTEGPIFRRPVPVRTGEVVLREERFNYCDLLPA